MSIALVVALALFGIAVWNAVASANGEKLRWSVAAYWAVVAIYWAERVFEV